MGVACRFERAVGEGGVVRVDGAAAEQLLVEGEVRVGPVGLDDFEDLGPVGMSGQVSTVAAG